MRIELLDLPVRWQVQSEQNLALGPAAVPAVHWGGWIRQKLFSVSERIQLYNLPYDVISLLLLFGSHTCITENH
jgi:hypothetical protein